MRLVDEVNNIFEDAMRKQFGLPDWTFREIPWIKMELFDELVETVGSDNIRVISGTNMQRRQGDEVSAMVRASILISPEGMERLRNASDESEAKG